MVSFRVVGRAVPRVRTAVTQSGNRKALVLPLIHPSQMRLIHRGPFWREPFSQMEEFMKDMERKFKRDIEDTLGTFAKNVSANTNNEVYMYGCMLRTNICLFIYQACSHKGWHKQSTTHTRTIHTVDE